MSDELTVNVRQRRDAAGLTQIELADAAGISRQALSAIEAGRQVPSTLLSLRLAEALGCAVEDLFSTSGPSPMRALLAPGSGHPRRVALGRVANRWVAHPLTDPTVAADGIVVGDATGSTVSVTPLITPRELTANVLVAGCAPLLAVAGARTSERFRDARPHWLQHTSARALELLEHDLVHVAGIHFHDDGGQSNEIAVRARFAAEPMAVVNLVGWRQGIVLPPGNPRGIETIEDLANPKHIIAWREPGAASRRLLEQMLADAGVPPEEFPRGPTVVGQMEIARSVAAGMVDAGIAIETAALAHGLSFIPLVAERFDLVMRPDVAEQAPVARLLEILRTPTFLAEAHAVGGYDLADTGLIRTVDAR